MGRTVAEKVLSSHAGSDCRAGEIVVASVDFAMAQDGTSTMMIRELEALGFKENLVAQLVREFFDLVLN